MNKIVLRKIVRVDDWITELMTIASNSMPRKMTVTKEQEKPILII